MFNVGIPATLTDFHINAKFFKIGLPELCKILVFGIAGLDGKLQIHSAYIHTRIRKAFPGLIHVKFVLRAGFVMSPKAGRYKAAGKLSTVFQHPVDHFFIRERIRKRLAEFLVAAGFLFRVEEKQDVVISIHIFHIDLFVRL